MLILYSVCSQDGACPLSDITHTSGVSKQTIHSALRKLEAEGIVCLETLDARRKKGVHYGAWKAVGQAHRFPPDRNGE